MHDNIALVVVSIVGIVVPTLKWWDDHRERKATARHVAEVKAQLAATTDATNTQLKEIHTLVNSRLTKAIELASVLMAILRDVAPADPRIRDLSKEVDKA